MPIIGEGTANGQTILVNGRGFVLGTFLKRTLNGANATHLLFQLFLGMAVCLIDGFGCFSKVMEVAQLMGDSWESRGDRLADGVLP